MTEEQFAKVKKGETLFYPYEGKIEKVKVRSIYRFAGGGRIYAEVIDSITGLESADAPYSCFELTNCYK